MPLRKRVFLWGFSCDTLDALRFRPLRTMWLAIGWELLLVLFTFSPYAASSAMISWALFMTGSPSRNVAIFLSA